MAQSVTSLTTKYNRLLTTYNNDINKMNTACASKGATSTQANNAYNVALKAYNALYTAYNAAVNAGAYNISSMPSQPTQCSTSYGTCTNPLYPYAVSGQCVNSQGYNQYNQYVGNPNPNTQCTGPFTYYNSQYGQYVNASGYNQSCQYIGIPNAGGCPTGYTMQNGTCVYGSSQCPTGYTYNAQANQCIQSNQGQCVSPLATTQYGGIPMCPTGYNWNSSTYQCCLGGASTCVGPYSYWNAQYSQYVNAQGYNQNCQYIGIGGSGQCTGPFQYLNTTYNQYVNAQGYNQQCQYLGVPNTGGSCGGCPTGQQMTATQYGTTECTACPSTGCTCGGGTQGGQCSAPFSYYNYQYGQYVNVYGYNQSCQYLGMGTGTGGGTGGCPAGQQMTATQYGTTECTACPSTGCTGSTQYPLYPTQYPTYPTQYPTYGSAQCPAGQIEQATQYGTTECVSAYNTAPAANCLPGMVPDQFGVCNYPQFITGSQQTEPSAGGFVQESMDVSQMMGLGAEDDIATAAQKGAANVSNAFLELAKAKYGLNTPAPAPTPIIVQQGQQGGSKMDDNTKIALGIGAAAVVGALIYTMAKRK